MLERWLKLLDPKGKYFSDRIISRDDGTVRHKKSLDVMGNEEAVLFVDESKIVWQKKYGEFFASSCKQFKEDSKLLPDESESDGALSTVLNVLKQTHGILF
ncbi:hypothetical protein ARALYDRAFT_888325 [Arabidopsis lyrata subsp. lyrata]|uniref:protein-serine/threonine phosphatase n=1 Tax=Arabidopsis lyrata subsp. lyrata TaxID=81972 RepID=D7KKS5_ARALL|nr:hypothetical protein ARALYDRAFT_888325 [Arabidopsis lyrata subsp. lyrata]